LLLEQGNLPRDRVCGEFISSESMDQLRWPLGSRAEALLGTAIAVPEVRFFSDGLVIRGELNAPGTSIARFDLDFALWQATTLSSIDGPLQVRVEKIEGDSPYRLLTNAGIFKARAVVKAVGRWSNLNAVVRDPGKDHRKWIGLKAHFYESNPHPSVDLYFFDGGYCGIQPASRVGFASGDRINVCAKVRADVAANLPAVFSRHPALSERSRNWQQLTTTVSTAPLIFRRPQAVEGRILHVGDAAGFVDPFAGDGISLALRSGALCANSLKGFVSESLSLDGAACLYRGAYAKEFLSIFGMSAKVRQIFFGLPRSLRWVVLSAAQRNPGMVTYFVRRTR
jgi:flavin-dependent dehydrogenase